MNKRWIFYLVNISAVLLIVVAGLFVFAYKNHLLWFKDIQKQTSVASNPGQQYCTSSTKIMTLEELKTAVANGKVTVNLNASGASASAVVVNQTDCTAPLVLNSYKMYSDNISQQTIFAESLATMLPNNTTSLTVNLPDCKAQVDLFYYVSGSVITEANFADHLLAYDYGSNSNKFCSQDNSKPIVSLAKTGPAQAELDSELSYSIQVINSGTGPANDIKVRDIFPIYLQFISSAQEYCQLTGQGIIECPVGDIPAGSTRNLQFTFKLIDLPPCGENIFNQAELTSTNFTTLTGSATTSVNNCTPPPPPPPPPVSTKECKLGITKSVDLTTAISGQQLTYSIKLENTGTGDCSGGGVKVEDVYSSNLEYVSEAHSANVLGGYAKTNKPVHDLASRTLTWNAQTLAPGAKADITWKAKIKSIPDCTEVAISNKARATADADKQVNTWVESNAVTTTAKGACIVDESLDLKVTKTANPTLLTALQSTVFSITVTNLSGITAHQVILKDTWPAGLEYVVHTVSQGGFSPTTGVWTLGSLASGSSSTLSLTLKANNNGVYKNTIEITSLTETDTNPANNKAEASVTVVEPAVPDVVCTPQNQSVLVGSKAVFVANGGNGSFNWQATEGTPSIGTSNTFETTYAQAGTKQVRLTSGTKTMLCTVQVSQPVAVLDLAVEKIVGTNNIFVNNSSSFTVTLRNLAVTNASNIRLKDYLPGNLPVTSTNASLGSYNSSNGEWFIPSLVAGGTANLVINVQPNLAGTFTNRVELLESTPTDSNSSNNSASATLLVQNVIVNPPPGDLPGLYCISDTNNIQIGVSSKVRAVGGTGQYTWSGPTVSPGNALGPEYTYTALSSGLHSLTVTSGVQSAMCQVYASIPQTATLQPDLTLAKTAEPKSTTQGKEVNFVLTLKNEGQGSSDLVSVKDVLPAGLDFVRAIASKGTYDASSGIWTVGLVQPGESYTLILTVKASKSGRFVNTAEVWTAGGLDIDSAPGNGNVYEDDFASASLTVGEALAQAGTPILPGTVFALGLLTIVGLLLVSKNRKNVFLSLPQATVKVSWEDKRE